MNGLKSENKIFFVRRQQQLLQQNNVSTFVGGISNKIMKIKKLMTSVHFL